MDRNSALQQLWRDRIEECRQSGLSIKAWCSQNGLKNTTFHYWVKKLKTLEHQEAGANTFAEVVLLPETRNNTKCLVKAELSLSYGNFSINIPDGFNPTTLTELVKVLQKL